MEQLKSYLDSLALDHIINPLLASKQEAVKAILERTQEEIEEYLLLLYIADPEIKLKAMPVSDENKSIISRWLLDLLFETLLDKRWTE